MGHNAQHTLDLPQKNETPDHQIIKIAQQEDRVVITKDSDFVQSYMVLGKPKLQPDIALCCLFLACKLLAHPGSNGERPRLSPKLSVILCDHLDGLHLYECHSAMACYAALLFNLNKL